MSCSAKTYGDEMKVKIGNYKNNLICNLYRNWIMFKYGEDYYFSVGEVEYETWLDKKLYKLDDIIQDFYNATINKVLILRNRKIKVKLDPWDAWSADMTLGYIALPLLKEIKETKQGAPFVEYADVPEHLRPSEEEIEITRDTGETDLHFFDRWDWVLDEMIFAFEKHLDPNIDDSFSSGTFDMDVEKVPGEKYSRLVAGANHTQKIDEEARKLHHLRVANGFLLFGKYYQCLWT